MANTLNSLYANGDSYARILSDTTKLSTSAVSCIHGWIRHDTCVSGGSQQWFSVSQSQSPYLEVIRCAVSTAIDFFWDFYEEDGTYRAVYGDHSLSPGRWYFAVFVFWPADNTYRLYVGDGTVTYPSGYTLLAARARGASATKFMPWRVGANPAISVAFGAYVAFGWSPLDGHTCGWATYSTTPSDDAINAAARDWPSETAPAGGLHLWKLNEATGSSTAKDFWGTADLTYTDGANGMVGSNNCPYRGAAQPYKMLAQANPHARTLTDFYLVQTKGAVVSTAFVCNRSSTPTTFRLALAPAGAADNVKHYVAYDVPLRGNESRTFTIGATLGTRDVARVYADIASVSVSLFGREID